MTKKFFIALFVTIVIVSCCVFLWISKMQTFDINEKYAANLVKNTLSIPGDVTAQKLTSGFSGAQLFAVTTDSGKYVVRFLTHKSKDERKREITILQIASKEGYGPHIYFADIDRGVVIMEFLQNQPITPEFLQSDEPFILLARFLQKIHHGQQFTDIPERKIFNAIPSIIQNLRSVCSSVIQFQKIEHIAKIIQQAVANHVNIAPCHNDLHPSNLIFLGDKFKAIDYELAVQSDPYFDIAMVASFYCETFVQEHLLLSTYLGRQPSEIEMAKLYLMKQIAFIYCALCFLKMVPERLQQYEKLQVSLYADFVQEMADGKINLENSEHKLSFAKVLINHVFENVESQEFSKAVALFIIKNICS